MIELLVREAWLSIRRTLILSLKKLEVSESEAYILLTIPPEGIKSSQIPLMVGLANGSATRTLNKLERRLLIYKEHGSHDKRVIIYYLTLRGLQLRTEVKNVILKYREAVEVELGSKNIKVLSNALTSIVLFNENVKKKLPISDY